MFNINKELICLLVERRKVLLYSLFIFIVTLTYSLLYNISLFNRYYPETYFLLAFLMSIMQNLFLWFLISINRWIFSIMSLVFFVGGAIFNYYGTIFHLDINVDTMEIAFNTNLQEALSVINNEVISDILVALLISLLFIILRFYIKDIRGSKNIIIYLLILGLIAFSSKPLESITRKVKISPTGVTTNLGFKAMPMSIVEAGYHYILGKIRLYSRTKKRQYIDIPKVISKDEDIIVIFLLTDSLRYDHLQINGYHRNTTPFMILNNMISFKEMEACESSTTKSVPCLMTSLNKGEDLLDYVYRPSLINIFQVAGFDTGWISSHVTISTADRDPLIIGNEADYSYFNDVVNSFEYYNDIYLLPKVNEFLNRDNKKKFLTVQLLGSHWDYKQRYNKEYEIFKPACDVWLYDCPINELVNAYDNTIVATDALFKNLIDMVKDKKAIIFFTSDHGQYLGEDGRRLHVPGNAHKAVLDVPFVVWMSESMKNSSLYINIINNSSKKSSHDYIFHSIADCSGLSSYIINKELSVCSEYMTDYSK